ncbi:MAG: endonuclease/exonuclease/phosphatase family protein [Sedimenticolaceae bacterium]
MLRVATYNAHDCIGRDGQYAPDRIAQVISALNADVVALQEITLDHAGDVLASLEVATGLKAIDGTLFERGVGRYGNLLLTRQPVISQLLHDISFAGKEPRGLIEAELELQGRSCRVYATHLGLASHERHQQLARIGTLLGQSNGAAILLGDFNVWFGIAAFRPLHDGGFFATQVRSYPTWSTPLLPLDRVFARAPATVVKSWRSEESPARMASDHFPIVADIRLGCLR